ncbi:MAG: hypothetical protein KAU38_17015 [Desulfobacterales bacterium]|nr:hypothetical protein [Desulfobacterales bacterium]
MDLAEIRKLVEAGESETPMNSAVNNVSEFLQPIECISFFETWIFASCRNDGIMEYWNDGFLSGSMSFVEFPAKRGEGF